MKLIDADKLIEIANTDGAYGYVSVADIDAQPTIQPQGVDKDRLIEEFKNAMTPHLGSDSDFAWNMAISKAIDIINEQPTSDGWIPVSSGKFPKIDEDVLCFRGHYIGELQDVYVYKGEDKWVDSYGYYQTTEEEGITAWQPLPQPYKESD